MNYNRSSAINFMVKSALLSAIAVVFMYFDFPILPTAPFLKIDFSDVPALIGGFALGPAAGIIIEAFKIFLIMIIKGTGTGGVGEFANFLIGVSFVFPAALIYHSRKNFKSAVVSMLAAIVSMNIVGILANYYILAPLYGMPVDQIGSYITAGVIPFNLIKGVMVAVITLASYKKLSPIIKKESALANKKIA